MQEETELIQEVELTDKQERLAKFYYNNFKKDLEEYIDVDKLPSDDRESTIL